MFVYPSLSSTGVSFLRFLPKIYVFLFYVYVLPACMFVHLMCVWCLWRSEEEAGSLGLRLWMVVSCHVGLLLEPVLLATEPSLSPVLATRLVNYSTLIQIVTL